MKSCGTCGASRPLEDFHRSSRNKDGRQSRCKICTAAYYLETAEKQKKAFREWRAVPENLARAKETRKKYLQTERGRDAKRNDKMRRRALTGAGDFVTMADVTALHGTTCLFPGCLRKDIEMDHVVPLARGGAHALHNLQPLCRSHNASKNAKTIDYREVTV